MMDDSSLLKSSHRETLHMRARLPSCPLPPGARPSIRVAWLALPPWTVSTCVTTAADLSSQSRLRNVFIHRVPQSGEFETSFYYINHSARRRRSETVCQIIFFYSQTHSADSRGLGHRKCGSNNELWPKRWFFSTRTALKCFAKRLASSAHRIPSEIWIDTV